MRKTSPSSTSPSSSPPSDDSAGRIDALIATRLLALRQAKGLSLAALAELSGVSKAMISKVERVQSSPTAVLLGRLAAGLGVSLAQLLTEEKEGPQRLRTKAAQEVWRDPEAGYLRRQVAERGTTGSGVELVEVELPRSAQVGYPRWSGKPYRQCLWMLEGALAGGLRRRALRAGARGLPGFRRGPAAGLQGTRAHGLPVPAGGLPGLGCRPANNRA
jgi:transcriptional regulator with XRE-family HTH domain